MAVKQRSEIKTDVASKFADNGANQITASIVRGFLNDFADSATFENDNTPALTALANAIAANETALAALNSALAGKQPLASVLTNTTAAFTTALKSTYDAYAAAIAGKQPLATVLTNTSASFTTALLAKLNDIQAGAQVNLTPTQIRDALNTLLGGTEWQGGGDSLIDADHYKDPVLNLAALAALPYAGLASPERRFVIAELADYFWEATAESGDVEPDDKPNGADGFWQTVPSIVENIDEYAFPAKATRSLTSKTLVIDPADGVNPVGEQTTVQRNAELDARFRRPRNNQTGASYTLVLTDEYKIVDRDNASANTLSIPLNAAVAFATNTQIDVSQLGAGVTTIDAPAGVTLNGVDGGNAALSARYGVAHLRKIGTDAWVVNGNVGAVS